MKYVPTNKLLLWYGIFSLPMSIIIALIPEATAVGILLAAGMAIFAIIDAVISKNSLGGVHVTMPSVVRLSVGRQSELTLSIENEDLKVKRLRLGLAFPREIYSSHHDRITDLPEETSGSVVVLRSCRSLRLR